MARKLSFDKIDEIVPLNIIKGIEGSAKVAGGIAIGALIALALLITANVVSRLLGVPIVGTFEIVTYGTVIVAAGGIVYCQFTKSQIVVNILVSRLPERAQQIIDTITCIISIGFTSVLIWQGFSLSHRMWLAGDIATSIRMPIFPFAYAATCGWIMLSLVLLLDLFRLLRRGMSK